MLTDITKYVAQAFALAGDLVKTLTMTVETKGDFNTATGLYATSPSTFTVEVLDDDDDTDIVTDSRYNKTIRKYIVKSKQEIFVGIKFDDDSRTYTIFRLRRIQQNSVIFIYEMWAEV